MQARWSKSPIGIPTSEKDEWLGAVSVCRAWLIIYQYLHIFTIFTNLELDNPSFVGVFPASSGCQALFDKHRGSNPGWVPLFLPAILLTHDSGHQGFRQSVTHCGEASARKTLKHYFFACCHPPRFWWACAAPILDLPYLSKLHHQSINHHHEDVQGQKQLVCIRVK